MTLDDGMMAVDTYRPQNHIPKSAARIARSAGAASARADVGTSSWAAAGVTGPPSLCTRKRGWESSSWRCPAKCCCRDARNLLLAVPAARSSRVQRYSGSEGAPRRQCWCRRLGSLLRDVRRLRTPRADGPLSSSTPERSGGPAAPTTRRADGTATCATSQSSPTWTTARRR